MLKIVSRLQTLSPFHYCRRGESKTSTFAEKILESQSADPTREKDEKGIDFRVLEIYPKKKEFSRLPRVFNKTSLEIMPPRHHRMSTTQDWPSVWPTAHSFKASAIPLPIRMGFLKSRQRAHKAKPKAYANLELMKIPNFLHLTPTAIQRHCRALIKFCNKWPEGVDSNEQREKHFPIELIYSDYVFAGPSVRDARARCVTLKVNLDALELDEQATIKFIKLAGDKYNKKTNAIALETDRCPVRTQNRDYAMYLLTALFHQSWKRESWEKEAAEADRLSYSWNGTASRGNLLAYLQLMKKAHDNCEAEKSKDSREAIDKLKKRDKFPEFINKTEPSDFENVEEIREFKNIVEKYRNEGENEMIVKNYSNSVRKLLGLPNL